MREEIQTERQEAVGLRGNWSESERAERRLLAQLKQQWLAEFIGIEDPWQHLKVPVAALAKAS